MYPENPKTFVIKRPTKCPRKKSAKFYKTLQIIHYAHSNLTLIVCTNWYQDLTSDLGALDEVAPLVLLLPSCKTGILFRISGVVLSSLGEFGWVGSSLLLILLTSFALQKNVPQSEKVFPRSSFFLLLPTHAGSHEITCTWNIKAVVSHLTLLRSNFTPKKLISHLGLISRPTEKQSYNVST